jgi:hypothetical protein
MVLHGHGIAWWVSVLIEQPGFSKRIPVGKSLWIAGAIILAVIVTLFILLATHWPFTRDAVSSALEEASGRPVEIGAFTNSYFPPGCTAGSIRFLHRNHPEAPPLITIERLVIQGSLTGMFTSPKRLAAVRVFGMRMQIPPKSPDGEGKNVVSLNAGPGGKSLAISKITADGSVLEFLPEQRGGKSYQLKIDRLGITNIGSGAPMSYHATLTNTEPPGVIRAEGKFGPWNPGDIGATPVSGSYTYDDIDLSVFHGISGMGHARGKFSGLLARIQTNGSIDVAGFQVEGSDHAVQLATTFDAIVNGTNGDVFLNPAVTGYRHTRIEVHGSIAGQQNQKGKTVSLDLAVSQGRVDDLLFLFTKGQPGMSGNVTVNGKFVWPPGPRKFVQKIGMDLAFGMSGSRLTNPSGQDSIDHISESAQGESKKQQDADQGTVLSQIRGDIHLRNGIASITDASFSVPGANATVRGTYNLIGQAVDLRGTLDTQGQLSDATSGLKALVLKAVTPLFKKEGSMRIIPFDITGTYGKTSVTIDWKRDLAHR